jgi:hypothetical protein
MVYPLDPPYFANKAVVNVGQFSLYLVEVFHTVQHIRVRLPGDCIYLHGRSVN